MTGLTVVTGGAGFVGKALVAKLRAQGRRVRSFDLAEPQTADDIQGSILDADAVSAAIKGAKSVFHLAGNAQLWAKDPSIFDEINRRGTQTVIKAAQRATVGRFIHCSSLTTLAGKSAPIGPSHADETMRLAPEEMLGPYPTSKLLAERIVEEAAGAGLHAVIAMPTEPLGPGDQALTPPTKMILDFARGATPAYIDCLLNFVPVESIADGLIAAEQKGKSGERYLLGGENTPLSVLIEKIAAISGTPAPKMKMPYWVALAAGAIDTKFVAVISGNAPKAPLTGVRLAGRQISFSSEKAATELDWRAAPYESALEATIDWFRVKGWLEKA